MVSRETCCLWAAARIANCGLCGLACKRYSLVFGSLVAWKNTNCGFEMSNIRQVSELNKTVCPRSVNRPSDRRLVRTPGMYKTSEIVFTPFSENCTFSL